MWKRYEVELVMKSPLAASLPKTRAEILTMLEHRMPKKAPADAVSIEELTEHVAEEVGADSEESLPGWSTFPRDKEGLYYEGRCVRGHLKDCALQVANIIQPEVKNFRSKFTNKVYVETEKIRLICDGAPDLACKQEPDGMEQRFIQVMTRMGPRSSFKYIDYVKDVRLVFVLRILDDGVIKEDHLRTAFEYGGTHGLGQERSQGWGRYELKGIKSL